MEHPGGVAVGSAGLFMCIILYYFIIYIISYHIIIIITGNEEENWREGGAQGGGDAGGQQPTDHSNRWLLHSDSWAKSKIIRVVSPRILKANTVDLSGP